MSSQPIPLFFRGLIGYVALAVVLLGCEKQPERKARVRSELPQPAELSESDAASTKPVATMVPAGEKPWIENDRLPWEAWYLQYLDGVRIGYSHVRISGSAIASDNDRIRIDRVDRFEVVDSKGVKARFTRTQESIEFKDGRLSTFTDSAKSASSIAETDGKLIQEKNLTLTTTANQESTSSTVAWEKGTWGLMGIQAMLMQRRPQSGEILQGTVFVPQLNKIAKTELLAGEREVTALPNGKTESLLPVDVVLWAEETGMRSRNWVNEQGEVMKTISLSGPNMSTFWAPPEIAQRTRDELALADILERTVKLTGYQPTTHKQAVYEVARSADSTAQEVYSLLSKTDFQKVVSINALSAEVTVTEADPSLPTTTTSKENGPNSEYLASSTFIPAEHSVIVQLAEALAIQDDSPVETAKAMTKALHEKFSLVGFDREVTSPLQVARQLRGDSVEAAILLTTLLRSQKIPARVASGIIVDPQNPSQMIFHMWCEAWLNERWIPLDAALGGFTSIHCLKFFDHSLLGENPYVAILPVFEEMSGLSVRELSQN